MESGSKITRKTQNLSFFSSTFSFELRFKWNLLSRFLHNNVLPVAEDVVDDIRFWLNFSLVDMRIPAVVAARLTRSNAQA